MEPLAWIAAAGAYLAVTAVLAMDTPGGEKAEILHPRYWIWLPLMGLLMAAPPLSGVFTLMMIAHYLGVFPEAWIVPGLFVFWTVLMLWLWIDKGGEAPPPKRRGVLSLKSARAATLRSAPASPAPQPSAAHAGTPATTDGAMPLSVLPPAHAYPAAGGWDDGSARAAADSACKETVDSAPAAADNGCASPASSSTSHSWYGGDDSSDSGGGDSD